MSKTILYLSGPITGVENYRSNFKMAAIALKKKGYAVINPAELIDVLPLNDLTYDDIMDVCLGLLDMASGVVMLPGWQDSKGANRELGYAQGQDKIVLDYEVIVNER